MNFLKLRGIPFEEITALENLSERQVYEIKLSKNYLNY
jgi:hypothetical protein